MIDQLYLYDPANDDGDTIRAIIVLPLDIMVRRYIRPRGFFAAEIGWPADSKWFERAQNAKNRFSTALNSSVVSIAVNDMKNDPYGRVLCLLLFDGKPADPLAVLGDALLAYSEHQQQLKDFREWQRTQWRKTEAERSSHS